jgi:hypothetical protein
MVCTKQTDVAAKAWACIRKLRCSNHVRTPAIIKGFSLFTSVRPGKCWNNTPILPLSLPFRSIPIHYSPNHCIIRRYARVLTASLRKPQAIHSLQTGSGVHTAALSKHCLKLFPGGRKTDFSLTCTPVARLRPRNKQLYKSQILNGSDDGV